MGTSRQVGTLAWARRTGGRLSTADQCRLATEVVAAQLARIPKNLARRLGLPTRDAPLDLAVPQPPDTPLAREAKEMIEAVSSEPLLHHLHRVFAWGHMLAKRRGHRLDGELYYLAALLHDLGLAGAEPAAGSCCFAYDGAEGALGWLHERGMPEPRAAVVADAICLHLNVRVSLAHGPEAHILHAAAALDVIGLGKRAIPEPLLLQVLEEHPRWGWNDEILPILAKEADQRPGCRIGFLIRHLAFGRRARKARFPGQPRG